MLEQGAASQKVVDSNLVAGKDFFFMESLLMSACIILFEKSVHLVAWDHNVFDLSRVYKWQIYPEIE